MKEDDKKIDKSVVTYCAHNYQVIEFRGSELKGTYYLRATTMVCTKCWHVIDNVRDLIPFR